MGISMEERQRQELINLMKETKIQYENLKIKEKFLNSGIEYLNSTKLGEKILELSNNHMEVLKNHLVKLQNQMIENTKSKNLTTEEINKEEKMIKYQIDQILSFWDIKIKDCLTNINVSLGKIENSKKNKSIKNIEYKNIYAYVYNIYTLDSSVVRRGTDAFLNKEYNEWHSKQKKKYKEWEQGNKNGAPPLYNDVINAWNQSWKTREKSNDMDVSLKSLLKLIEKIRKKYNKS